MDKTENSNELFADDFSAYPVTDTLSDLDQPGLLGREVLGDWTQTSLHYSWHSRRMPSYRECRLPWRVVEGPKGRRLQQPERFKNVVLRAGDAHWRNYRFESSVIVTDSAAGFLVRYQTSREYYWIRFTPDRTPELIRRRQEEQVLLAAAEGPTVRSDTAYDVVVICEEDEFAVLVGGNEVIRVSDGAYPFGRIGLRSDGPCSFGPVRVSTEGLESPEAEIAAVDARSAARTAMRNRRSNRYPAPTALREIEIPVDAGYVQIQDVNGDGVPEIITIEAEVPELDYIRFARLSVFDWDGGVIWQAGKPKDSRYAVHGDIAFNTADIDADGKMEFLVTRDFEIQIIDAATGTVKASKPTPEAYWGMEDKFERTVGDSFLVCNLRGLDTPQDFILKDRYRNLWAYTSELKPLWHRHLNTGHYPRAADIDGDGRDEIIAGYSLLGSDGTTRWTVEGGDPDRNRYPGPEHADSVLIGVLDGVSNEARIAMAASDLGFILMDAHGEVLAHHLVGHAQSMGAAAFRPDLPGRQFAVQTFWGNPGILYLFDRNGAMLTRAEHEWVGLKGTVPINWRGDGGALLLGNGALLDGSLEPVVELPRRDAAASFARPFAMDVNNDGVDEILMLTDNTLVVLGPKTVPSNPAATPKRDLTNWNLYGGFLL